MLVPVASAEAFRNRLATLPATQRVNWARHKINKGETISAIALHYKTTAAVIREANKLSSNNIRAGKYLLIPSAKNDSSEYSLSQTQRFNRKQNQLAQSDRDKTSYQVQAGDSFWKIANEHNVSVRELASWNQMAPGDPLRVGKNLTLWKAKTNQGLSRSDEQMIRRVGYSVRSGDSLYTIADRFRVSISDIKRWNKLEKSKYLQPGQRLTLYVDITKAN